MLSTACKDALRAMIYIAKQKLNGRDKYISINEIANELDLSFYFLSKILQQLVKAGFLESYRGPNGGVKLAKDPEDIKIIDIVATIDGLSFFTDCVLGLDECCDENPCPLHQKWVDKREDIYELFSGTSLKDILEDINKLKYVKL